MKLKNKKTGEIGYTAVLQAKAIVVMDENAIQLGIYNSLAKLNSEWEDYEKPKEYWFIDIRYPKVEPKKDINLSNSMRKRLKEIGNYFETEEEAEQALEKLKAVKRLKDKGFRFKNDSLDICCHTINFKVDTQFDMTDETSRDLHLLFGGERMNDINDLPAFTPVNLTKEQAEKLAQIAKEAREKYEKNKKDN